MTVQLSNYLDFYLLLGLENATRPSVSVRSKSRVYDSRGVYSQGEHHILADRDKLRADICSNFNVLCDSLSRALHDYIFLACCGEARHAYSHSKMSLIKEIPNVSSRDAVYALTHEFDPKDGLGQLVELFDKHWSGSFGGPKWGAIAEAGLLMYKPSIPKAVFIDHCADLKHNGGMAYNKTSTQNYTNFQLGEAHLERLLDWKLKSNVLTEPPSASYKPYTSVTSLPSWFKPDVKTLSLIQRYYRVWMLKEPPDWAVWCQISSNRWGYEGISYGTKQLTVMKKKDFVPEKKNSPHHASEPDMSNKLSNKSMAFSKYNQYSEVVKKGDERVEEQG